MGRMAWLLLVAAVVGAILVISLRPPDDGPEPLPPPSGREPPPSSAPDTPIEAQAPSAPALTGAPSPSPRGPREAPSAETGEGTRFAGTVLTAAGTPAAGASVEVGTGEGVAARVTTDAQGTFGLRVVVTDAMKATFATLRARGTDGMVGWLAVSLGGTPVPGAAARVPAAAEPRNLGTIRLGPAHAFGVRVVGTCPTARPATIWVVTAQPMEVQPWAVVTTDAEGVAEISGVPEGTFAVLAGAPGCGRARALVKLPREDTHPLVLELGEGHVLTVRVRDAADASPISGALVRVTESVRLPEYGYEAPLVSSPSSYTTDALGTARIEGLAGTERLSLRAEAEGYPASQYGGGRRPGTTRTEPGQGEVVLELKKAITVRWPLQNEGIGIPASGTEVALEPWTNTGRLTVPPRGVVEGRELVVAGWGPDGASGYAVIAGRGVARLQAQPGATEGHPTAFYPLRKIELLLRQEGGTPASGWFLVARDEGNNEVKPGVPTDAEGRAILDGLYGGPTSRVNVSVGDLAGWGGFQMGLGSVDLAQGDGRFEATIPSEHTLRVRLTVQGRPPPAGFPGLPWIDRRPAVSGQGTPPVPSEPGLFLVPWRPRSAEAKLTVSAQAAGYLAETKTLARRDVEGQEVVIDLTPAGTLRVKVIEPEDKRYRIGVARWNPKDATWGSGGSPNLFVPGQGDRADPNGFVEFANLEPGRYRAVELLTSLTSEAVDVRAGAPPAEIPFDVSGTGWVKGRVLVPEGATWEGIAIASMHAKPGDLNDVFRGAQAGATTVSPKDGVFWLRVSGKEPVTIRPYHATLRPHPTRGQATVSGAQEDVVLELVRGATATLRFRTPAPVYVNRGQPQPISVRLYEGEPEGPGMKLTGVLDGAATTVVFGGYEPGAYTVWVDAPGSVPVVLRNVTLTGDDADLGTVDLSLGATLEIQVKVKEGQSPPRYSIWLTRRDEPSYTRSADVAGTTMRVTGIGVGRFRVNATAYSGAAPGIQEEIEFDGLTKVVRTLEIR